MSIAAPDWIAHHAAFSPDRRAVTDIHSGRTFTYSELNERCGRFAHFLRQNGVQKGGRVVVLCHNSTDIFEVQFACQKIGAVFVPLNWRLAGAEIAAIVGNAAPDVLIYGSEFSGIAGDLKSSGALRTVICTNYGAASEFEEAISASPNLESTETNTHDDIFAIMYTSGTTGLPKGVVITHRMTIFTGFNGMMKTGVDSSSTGLTFLPLFHVGGLFLMANFIFQAGGHNVVMHSFDADLCLKLLGDRELRISHAFGVPTNFAMMAERPGFARSDLSHVRCLMVGGAPSPMGLLQAYADKQIRLQQGWGMTETATIGTVLSSEAAFSKIGSAGLPVLHAELTILDEAFRPVKRGEIGQLAIRGPTVTPGYWRQPDATREAFHDGWFLTGDAAQVDHDGYYFIVDRWKDMFISGGENVYPAEIESVLSKMPGIAEAAIIGVPDEKWGEVGCAYVTLQTGASLTPNEILSHCANALARFKLPKHVRLVSEIPHTAAGKIAKPELRALYRHERAANR